MMRVKRRKLSLVLALQVRDAVVRLFEAARKVASHCMVSLQLECTCAQVAQAQHSHCYTAQARHSHEHEDWCGSNYLAETQVSSPFVVLAAAKKHFWHGQAATKKANLGVPLLAPHHGDWIHCLMLIPNLCKKIEVSASVVELKILIRFRSAFAMERKRYFCGVRWENCSW